MEHRVALMGGSVETGVATGIVRHPSANVSVSATDGFIHSVGRQSRSGDSLAMFVAFPPSRVIKPYRTNDDDAVALLLTQSGSLTMVLGAVWQGEPMVGISFASEALRSAGLRRLQDPLKVSVE
jgi:hypothetical protein